MRRTNLFLLPVVWLAIAAGTFVVCRSAKRLEPETVSERSAAPQLRRATISSGKVFPIAEWRALESNAAKLDLLHAWLATASPGELRRFYENAEQLADDFSLPIFRGAALDRWLQVDPDSAWEACFAAVVTERALVEHWLRNADPLELWKKIEAAPESYRLEQIRNSVFGSWRDVFPGEVDRLQAMTGADDEEMEDQRLWDAVARKDIDELLRLAVVGEAYSIGDDFYDIMLERRKADPAGVVAFADRIPEHSRAEYLRKMFESWPENIDPTAAINWTFGRDNPDDRGIAINHLLKGDISPEIRAEVVGRIVGGEGELPLPQVNAAVKLLSMTDQAAMVELLPELDPLRRGFFIGELGSDWDSQELEGALDFSETLQLSHQRDEFLSRLFAGEPFTDTAALARWVDQRSPDELKSVNMVAQLEQLAHVDADTAVSLAEKLHPEEQEAVWHQAINAKIDESLEEASAFIHAHPELRNERTVDRACASISDPQAAVKWREALFGAKP